MTVTATVYFSSEDRSIPSKMFSRSFVSPPPLGGTILLNEGLGFNTEGTNIAKVFNQITLKTSIIVYAQYLRSEANEEILKNTGN